MISREFLELGRIILHFPLSYKFIKEFYIREEVNEHGTCSLRLVSDEAITQKEVLRLEDVPIQVYTPDGTTIFSGFCISAGLSNLNAYSEITIEAKSWSYKMDLEKYSRTFQSPTKKLSEVVDSVLGKYGFSITLQKDIPITVMLSQQDETDWHFIRRIANQFGFMVFVDSKAGNKHISIGVAPFTEQKLPESISSTLTEKDIKAFWRVKNGQAADASAYEFMKQGYQLAELSMGAGHGISGSSSPQVITKSEITSNQGLLTNSIVLMYQDGIYPPAANEGVQGIVNENSEFSSSPIQSSGSAVGSSVVSGVVLAVSGNDIQVLLNVDESGAGVRWLPYGCFLNNDFYCMPDIGDTVFCYYENDGTIACLGSKHVNTGAPDFSIPENKVLTANNRMIKQKSDGIDITGSRSEMDGLGGERIKITISDSEGIVISASKEVNITADHTVLIQANDLETVKEEPTEWLDSEREERMANFDVEQTIGSNKYIEDGGNDSYNAGWDLTKTLGGNLIKGFIDDITSPFQLIGTISGLISPTDPTPEPPLVTFEKVDEYQIMILGLQSCTLQVPGSTVYFSSGSIIISSPKFWWFGFNRSSDYPQVSESQQTFMDSVMDAVQLGIDLVGCIPGCNIICGALNAGISLLRGDYYGALSGVIGMLCPGGGLVTRGLGMLSDASKTVKKVLKILKILKAGATALNAIILSAQDVINIIDQVKNGEFHITDADDLALLVSLGRNGMTAYQSGKDVYDETKKPKQPDGDAVADKEPVDSGDNDKKPELADSTEQKPENEVTCNDPIDVITGSQKIVQTDFVIKDITDKSLLVRTYQSVHKNENGLLGSKWFFNFGSWILVEGNRATVIMPDMHLEHFTKVDEEWVNDRSGDRSIQMTEGKEEFHLMVLAKRKCYTYNSSGRLVTITDKNKNNTWIRYVNNTLTEITFTGGQKLCFDYVDGKVSSITDVIGRVVRYRYEGELLTEVEYPNHGVVHYSYTPEGYLKQAIDQNGHAYVHNDYDIRGRVTRQVLSTGQEYVVLYDDSRRINTFLTVQNGRRFEYHYNKDKLLTKKVYMDDTFEEMGYDEHQNKIYVRDRMGGTLFRRFDENGKILEENQSNGLITYFKYDESGNLTQEWNNEGRTKEFLYDEWGNCTLLRSAIDEGNWQETAFEYDTYGRVLTVTDPRGNKTESAYQENHGGIILFTTAEGATFHYTYDEAGRRMSVIDEFGRTEYAYNHLDYLAMAVDPLGNTTKYFFDMLCNLTKVIRPNQYDHKTGDGAGIRYYYDAFDKQIKRIDPLGNVFAHSRDLEENIIKEIHPNAYDIDTEDGDGICYDYDQDDRRIKVVYPDGGVARIKYDANGNIIKRIQPEQYDTNIDDGPGYTYEYNGINQLVQITNPEGIAEHRYVYNLNGNITKEMDAQGCLSGNYDEERIGILYRYNVIGWLIQKREPGKKEDGQVRYQLTEYCYDAAGNVTKECRFRDFQNETSASGPVHIISFDYDKDNRRIRVSDSTNAVMEYGYNSRNLCILEKKKFNEQLFQISKYEYDAAGRMICAASSMDKPDGKQGFAKTLYTYDKSGNITKISLPEGGGVYREYDAADRLITEIHEDKKSRISNQTEFAYDKAGNLVRIIDSLGRKTTIEYNWMNRKSGVQGEMAESCGSSMMAMACCQNWCAPTSMILRMMARDISIPMTSKGVYSP